jgi:hypothetical protein
LQKVSGPAKPGASTPASATQPVRHSLPLARVKNRSAYGD